MATTKLPSIQFYPGDWLRDNVSGCSLAAQGLWLRMMFLMHDSDRYGYLSANGSPIPSGFIARKCGCDTLSQYETLLSELDSAGVPSRTEDGIIYSRRMVRDAKRRKQWRDSQSRKRLTSTVCQHEVNTDVNRVSSRAAAAASSSSSFSLSASKLSACPPTPQTNDRPPSESGTGGSRQADHSIPQSLVLPNTECEEVELGLEMGVFGAKVEPLLNGCSSRLKCHLVKFRSACVVFVNGEDPREAWRSLRNEHGHLRGDIECVIRKIKAFAEFEVWWAFQSGKSWHIQSNRRLAQWLK